MEKVHDLGSRWTLMVPFFRNRTDAMIKNRYQVLRRKPNREARLPTEPNEPEDIFDDSSLKEELYWELEHLMALEDRGFFG
jgi:hypothetical protein